MSLWIRLCNHTYIHTYIQTHRHTRIKSHATSHYVRTRNGTYAHYLRIREVDSRRCRCLHGAAPGQERYHDACVTPLVPIYLPIYSLRKRRRLAPSDASEASQSLSWHLMHH